MKGCRPGWAPSGPFSADSALSTRDLQGLRAHRPGGVLQVYQGLGAHRPGGVLRNTKGADKLLTHPTTFPPDQRQESLVLASKAPFLSRGWLAPRKANANAAEVCPSRGPRRRLPASSRRPWR